MVCEAGLASITFSVPINLSMATAILTSRLSKHASSVPIPTLHRLSFSLVPQSRKHQVATDEPTYLPCFPLLRRHDQPLGSLPGDFRPNILLGGTMNAESSPFLDD